MNFNRFRALVIAVAIMCVPAAAQAQAVLAPPLFNWGPQQNENSAPVSIISYDTVTGKPCIVGSSSTCVLATSGSGGGGGGGSISGFAPAGSYASLSAGTASSNIALPTGTVVLVQNTGSTAAFVNLGNSSVTATAAHIQVQPNSWIALTVGNNAYLAAITSSGTDVLTLVGGSGLASGAGGGSSGGGGSTPTGSAGSPNAAIITVQGVANATPIPTSLAALPNFIAPPTVNLGTLNGAATAAGVAMVNTTLGNPFQAGASIGNLFFGARIQDASGNPFGTTGNPIFVSGSGGSSTPTGSAGSPNAAIITVQGVANATPIPTSLASLPNFIAPPTVNLGTLNGAATAAGVAMVNTTLGNPFQAGASIGNLFFGARIQDASGNPFGTTGNPIFVSGGGGSSTPTGSAGSPNAAIITIQGVANATPIPTSLASLPNFTAPPTVNLGTLNGAATAAGVATVNTTLGSPFQAGASIGNLFFGARMQDASGNAFGTAGNPVVTSQNGTAGVNSNAVPVYDADVVMAVNAVTSSIINPDSRPAAQTITTADVATTVASGFNGVSIYSGTPTAGSTVLYKLVTSSTTDVQVQGTWIGTLQFESSIDNGATGGTLWQIISCDQQTWNAPTTSITGNGTFECNTAGRTGFRVRALALASGTPTVNSTFTPQSSPRNPKPVRITDPAGDALAVSSATADINVTTASTTQLVAAITGKAIYVTQDRLTAAGTTNVSFIYGTGTNCGTSTVTLDGPTALTAQSGWAEGAGLGSPMVIPAGNALCIVNSAVVQVGGHVTYAQF